MRVVVSLAGPDFIGADGGLKADQLLDGVPLLPDRRPWHAALEGRDYCFVLPDAVETRDLAAGRLRDWFPGFRTVLLSDFTRGAALSAAAGMAMHDRDDAPVIVDLADIDYACDLDPRAVFAEEPGLGAIALTFASDNPVYSYLATDAQGRFTEAAEKRVISGTASAGTYIFAGTATYLRALAHALDNEASQTHRDLFFVCPLFNGVRAQGRGVALHPVTDLRDIKTGD
jgi:hypothetical protein